MVENFYFDLGDGVGECYAVFLFTEVFFLREYFMLGGIKKEGDVAYIVGLVFCWRVRTCEV